MLVQSANIFIFIVSTIYGEIKIL